MATSPYSAIALDLGTTAVKAGLLDGQGILTNIVTQPAPVISASGGRYESDALAYALVADRVLGECLSCAGNAPPLGLCSQRSSFLVWARASGLPVSPLVSWQDNRGAASCDALRDSEGLIRALTGLRLAPYYFAPKLRVVLQEHPGWRDRLASGEWLAGTLDSFLIWRWTGGKRHVTDASMAARTLLMDVRRGQWSPVLCELFGVPVSILPEIMPSAGLGLDIRLTAGSGRPDFTNYQGDASLSSGFGLGKSEAARQPFTAGVARPVDAALVLEASMGDQSAALIASVGCGGSDVLVNLGTGGFALRYLPEGEATQGGAYGDTSNLEGEGIQRFHPHLNPLPQGGGGRVSLGTEGEGIAPLPSGEKGGDMVGDGYLRTLVFQDSRTHFALEGTLNSLAAALAPYPVGECGIEEMARDDIFCIAEPSGIGAPYFRNDLGIRFSASVDHLTPRQVGCLLLEGIVFRVARILEDFQRASAIRRVYLSGGLSELVCLQQGVALCAPCDVFRLLQKESSLQGAALLAAGLEISPGGDAEIIPVARSSHALPSKYLRWKGWFDALL